VTERPIPLLGDVPLEVVQSIEHLLDAGFVATPIAGLEGELHQRAARGSHRIAVRGMLLGEGAADALAKLQEAAAAGEEVSFAADIAAALELEQVVIESFHATEDAGRPGTYHYDLVVAESPPLPPPAELSPFGGLGDFGLGDLGMDLGVLDDISSLAEDVAGAVDSALDVVGALAGLTDLGSLGGLLEPMSRQVSGVGSVGDQLAGAARTTSEALS
jgi:hypothetical protein